MEEGSIIIWKVIHLKEMRLLMEARDFWKWWIDRFLKIGIFIFFGYTHQQQVNYVDSFERNELDDMLNSNTRRTNVVIFSLLVKI
jgi:hypothetical protein